MPILCFVNDGTYQVRSGIDLIKACQIDSSIPIKFGCRNGQCGTCAIKVVEGQENLSKDSLQERETLLRKKLDPHCHRLACQCAVNGNIVIDPVY